MNDELPVLRELPAYCAALRPCVMTMRSDVYSLVLEELITSAYYHAGLVRRGRVVP